MGFNPWPLWSQHALWQSLTQTELSKSYFSKSLLLLLLLSPDFDAVFSLPVSPKNLIDSTGFFSCSALFDLQNSHTIHFIVEIFYWNLKSFYSNFIKSFNYSELLASRMSSFWKTPGYVKKWITLYSVYIWS